jgi:hypothetical protein
MAELTVVYKYYGKMYIGITDEDSYITHFERLMVNAKDFDDNKLFIAMVGEGNSPEIVMLNHFTSDFSYITDDVAFIVMANKVLEKFTRDTVIH